MPVESIISRLPDIPKTSGVYKFLGIKDEILYVGKAKNLYKRIISYTKQDRLSARISYMIFLAQKVEIIQTASELEALLLEHNLIKQLSPKFNILLKDDKTFPHISITKHSFPKIVKHRGAKNESDTYFGPFASTKAVDDTISALRKTFLIRNCSDNDFKNRKKPCLEYQIKRCSAPCVKEISDSNYTKSIQDSILFLSGKSEEVQKRLKQRMQSLSSDMKYEQAAQIRDQLQSLKVIQSKQIINLKNDDSFDVITMVNEGGNFCFYVSFYRLGQNYGSKPYFIYADDVQEKLKILSDFIGQFYLSNTPPALILINHEVENQELLSQFLGLIAKSSISILLPKRGEKLQLIVELEKLAKQSLERNISENFINQQFLFEIKQIFNLDKIPQKIEVYDNSHISSTNAVGAMITAGPDGFIKNGYRKFNIRFEAGGMDDTAMLKEVFQRRFSKLDQKDYCDLIIIDGGLGQLHAAFEILSKYQVDIPFICISKGKNRNAGEEQFHKIDQESFTLPKHSPLMHYLQRLRDEAHRFAITSHRSRRKKSFFD